MPDPITMAIATAVAGRAAESLTEQARLALAEITRRVRRKFTEQPSDLATLTAAQDNPGSPEHISQLAHALRRAALHDPAFGRDIDSLWTQVRMEATARDDGVANIFHGQAEKVVQLRDIHGDLNIG
jgi:hypothetical protein